MQDKYDPNLLRRNRLKLHDFLSPVYNDREAVIQSRYCSSGTTYEQERNKTKNGTSAHINVLDQPGHLLRFIVVRSLNS